MIIDKTEFEYFKNQNIIDLDLQSVIYKYIPLKYIRLLVNNNSLFMGRVDAWDDVYENWFLKEKIVLKSGDEGIATNLIPGTFGQSWTLKEESDAMWRIYSLFKKNDNGSKDYLEESAIKIKTSACRLYDAIYVDEKCMANTYIGKVKYMSQSDFKELQDNLSPLSQSIINDVFSKSYFVKRDPFIHEEEVRTIVLHTPEDSCFGTNGISFHVNVNDFVDEYVADPRLTHEEYKYVRDALLYLGIPSHKIMQSSLYSIDPHTIYFE